MTWDYADVQIDCPDLMVLRNTLAIYQDVLELACRVQNRLMKRIDYIIKKKRKTISIRFKLNWLPMYDRTIG